MGLKNGKLGLLMGSNRFNIDDVGQLTGRKIATKYGSAFTWVGADTIVIPRHGRDSEIPPHMINHRANMLAFQKMGVEKVLSFTSVGSLKLELEPTNMLMPDDYINTGQILTYYDDKIRHIVPGLDSEFRNNIFSETNQLSLKIRFNGIYIQTQGPRLETKAEIQMLKNFGDVVGMTMASEATLAKELDIRYANISVVDNYCNGIIDEPLTHTTIAENQAKNGKNIEEIVNKILKK